MNNIAQKQIKNLVFDISRLYRASDIFNRATTYTIGTPGEGEAQLDNQTASSVTTLHIHTKDNLTGNRFSNLDSFQKDDTLIIHTQSGDVAKYNILSIQSVVDSSSEGHFILTLQHSFGYSGSFSIEELSYYFRRSASDELIQDLKAELAFISAGFDARSTAETIARANGDSAINQTISSKKKVFNETLSSTATTINHDMGDEDVIVQVLDSSGNVVLATINNFTLNSINVAVSVTGTYKIIIIA